MKIMAKLRVVPIVNSRSPNRRDLHAFWEWNVGEGSRAACGFTVRSADAVTSPRVGIGSGWRDFPLICNACVPFYVSAP